MSFLAEHLAGSAKHDHREHESKVRGVIFCGQLLS